MELTRDHSSRTKLAKKTEMSPNHSVEIARLKRVKGQIDGIEKMILERRYCPDIMIQIKAARAALGSLEASIMKTHLLHCVKNAMKSRDLKNADEKVQEIVDLILKG